MEKSAFISFPKVKALVDKNKEKTFKKKTPKKQKRIQQPD